MLKISPSLSLHFVLPSCLNCGSFYLFKKPLCLFCEDRFNQLQSDSIHIRHLQKLTVQYLYLWTNDEFQLNRKIIYSLKSKYSMALWHRYCEKFKILNLDWPTGTLLIPVPSTNANRFHTRYMSQILSQLWNRPVLSCLSKNVLTVEQKQQHTKADRLKIEFNVDPIINTWVKDNKIVRIVILDDVVTSGATLNAVYTALGKVLKDKEILISAVCLFSRE